MGNLELEVKILNIQEKSFIEKIEKLGAKFLEKVEQHLYTYDLPTIYGRYIDIITQIDIAKTKIEYETVIKKLEMLFNELENLLTEDEKSILYKILGEKTLKETLNEDNIKEILKSEELKEYMKKFKNNSKKWIRLRQTGKETTITVKHILADNGTNIQQMMETEMIVPSMKKANEFLEALGYAYKSYQEKRRITYEYEGYKIDIDTWPGIPTYFEVEGKDNEDLKYILQKLGYDIKDAVSCTADEIYVMYGKSMFEKRELKFY